MVTKHHFDGHEADLQDLRFPHVLHFRRRFHSLQPREKMKTLV
jgi:hypothetical protein